LSEVATEREAQGCADFAHSQGPEVGQAPPESVLEKGTRTVQIHCAGPFMPSSSVRTTSEGTSRIVDVIGATVTVDK